VVPWLVVINTEVDATAFIFSNYTLEALGTHQMSGRPSAANGQVSRQFTAPQGRETWTAHHV